MNDLFNQLRGVPKEVWYVALMLIGATIYAALIEEGGPKQALISLILGVFSGGLIILYMLGKWPTLNPYIMAALSGVAGLLGNWAGHTLLNQRTFFADVIGRVLREKYGPKNPS